MIGLEIGFFELCQHLSVFFISSVYMYIWVCMSIAHVENNYVILEDDDLIVDFHIETVFNSLVLKFLAISKI